jgi:hypothetical protein
MSQLMHAFNPMEHDPSQGGASWPLGKHPVIIEGAEVKATKDNANGRLVFKLRVIDGPNAGHTGDYGLNLYHQSADASRIAHQQLSAICHVVQVFQLGPDGTQLQYLFNKPFVIEVGLQKGEEAAQKGYTEVKRVYDINGNEPGKQGQAQQPAQAAGFGQQQQAAPQQQQQQNAAPQQGGAQAWGGQQQGQNPQQQAQGGNGQAWGQNGGQNAAQGQQAQQQGGWNQQQQGGGQSGGPAWGQRN